MTVADLPDAIKKQLLEAVVSRVIKSFSSGMDVGSEAASDYLAAVLEEGLSPEEAFGKHGSREPKVHAHVTEIFGELASIVGLEGIEAAIISKPAKTDSVNITMEGVDDE